MSSHKMTWAGLIIGLAVNVLMSNAITDYASNPSVQLFQEYLRIDTTTYSNLTPAVDFWTNLANKIDLPVQVVEFVPGMPIVIITWPGTDDSLPRIMLNSHIDVVPAVESEWTYHPLSGHLDENGDIYGRGTQDTKSISIQYYEALYRITQVHKQKLKRTVYMTLMPDEEVGGAAGMQMLVESELFKQMNVECEMDEGGPFPMPWSAVFYHDKSPWFVQIDCYGEGGHGSLFPDTNTTATGQCFNVINSFLEFREEQYEISTKVPIYEAGSYTSVNLNRLNGGTASNIIPNHVSLVFDIRLAINIEVNEFQAQLEKWVSDAGQNVKMTFIQQDPQTASTTLDDNNPYWVAIKSAAAEMDLALIPAVPPGATDARFIRSDKISAFGFSPMPNTPMLLHMADERLSAETFLRGIDIYEKIITNLGNLPNGTNRLIVDHLIVKVIMLMLMILSFTK